MQPLVHFEIHATDPDAAAKFYADMFDWKIKKWEGPIDYWLVTTKTEKIGIDGAITKRRGEKPSDGGAVSAYVCTISVASVDDAIEKVKNAGGSIADDKHEIPGVGWLAYAKDPEGNLFGMLQPL